LSKLPGISAACMADCKRTDAYMTQPMEDASTGNNCKNACIQVQNAVDTVIAKNFQQNCGITNTTNNTVITPTPAVVPTPTSPVVPNPPDPITPTPNPDPTTPESYSTALQAYAKNPLTWVICAALIILIIITLRKK